MVRISQLALGIVLGTAACIGSVENGGGGGGGQPDAGVQQDAAPTLDVTAKLQEWSGCQSLDAFTTANMAPAWGHMATVLVERCSGCHGSGAEGFIANEDPAVMFKAITENQTLMLQYFTIDGTGTVIVNENSFKAVTGASHPTHPRFNATDNPGMTALRDYYTAVAARQVAHTCDPSRLLP